MRERLLALVEFVVAISVVLGLSFAALSVWEPVRVSGSSMRPALQPGDLAIVGKDRRPKDGSIVLVRAAGHGAVLHRVVAVGRDGLLTTRGDANPVDDQERVTDAEVAGVVVRVVPLGELLRRWQGSD